MGERVREGERQRLRRMDDINPFLDLYLFVITENVTV